MRTLPKTAETLIAVIANTNIILLHLYWHRHWHW
jgi:hypothetical protein